MPTTEQRDQDSPRRIFDPAAFVTAAVERARALAASRTEGDELHRADHLAVVADGALGRTGPGADTPAGSGGDVGAATVAADLGDTAGGGAGLGRMRLAWDGVQLDPSVLRAESADRLRRLLGDLPTETVEVLRLCLGLDGADPVDPFDVADVLDRDPEVIAAHIWAAERLLRHQAGSPAPRRLAPMTELEFEYFRPGGDLAAYDLRGLNLNNADLQRCDLSQTILSGMNLWGVKLGGSRACGANLWGAQLDGADLRSADLRMAILERATLCGADLQGARLGEADLWSADLSTVRAEQVDLSGADLRGAVLAGADLRRADLRGADLSGADLRRARLSAANLTGANLQRAEVAGADLRWADLRDSDLCWTNLSVADLRGAALHRAIRSPLPDGARRRAPRPERLRPMADTA